MFKRILVPLDGSRLSTKAIPYASEIAKQFDAEMILLRVVEPKVPAIPVAGEAPSAIENPLAVETILETARKADVKHARSARQYLQRQLKKIEGEGIRGSYQVIAETIGTPAETITSFYRKNNVDLVVMTTPGRSGIKRAILGSVADEVIRTPGIPVLVVHPQK